MKTDNNLLIPHFSPEYSAILQKIGDILDTNICYGSNVLVESENNPKGDQSDLVVLTIYRFILDNLDGVSILFKNGSIDTTGILLRSIFEGLLALLYILEEETELRALSYQVAHYHKEIANFRKIDSNTVEGKKLRSLLKEEGIEEVESFDYRIRLDRIENILKHPKFQPIEEEWQKKKKKWFSLFGGPENIFELAEHFNFVSAYELLYRHWSNDIHGLAALDYIREGEDGDIYLCYLRDQKNLYTYSICALNFVSEATLQMITKYLPDKISEFKNFNESCFADYTILFQSI